MSKFGVGGAHPGGLNLTKELFKAESISENAYILDVGCGTGQTAAYLAEQYEAKVTGIDINPEMVAKAKRRMKKNRLPVKIIQCSIEQVSLRDHTFDFIISESVLSFVNKPNALKEIFRLLKNGGRFIAIEFTVHQPLEEKIEKEILQFYGFDSCSMKKDWVALLNEAGFNNIRIQKNKSIFSIPELQYSKDIAPELYEVMNKHFDMNLKYEGILDYRIYSCTK
ncbi:class I SAM-dependent methyltransferase [Lysinibacillus xylanilyticus]|uniref:class I SAM-dependent methyltransferase n=1 Tax=Lysinibacillus xylanilyticus TaxID=582475 RepID=UPI002B2558F9|nr:class I SAM-dependent methyltransferase [Lysinibacillus xylanilyticus]MEB2299144.1 class I SAM-dependent methyltransferase [Lysinibacillus xylanilyticus]